MGRPWHRGCAPDTESQAWGYCCLEGASLGGRRSLDCSCPPDMRASRARGWAHPACQPLSSWRVHLSGAGQERAVLRGVCGLTGLFTLQTRAPSRGQRLRSTPPPVPTAPDPRADQPRRGFLAPGGLTGKGVTGPSGMFVE